MRILIAIAAVLAVLSLVAVVARLPPPTAQPAKATAGRFAVQEGGKTVLDRLSGLRWQQGFSASPMDWAAAKTWCSANTPALPGSGWRLPTVRELDTVVDRQTQQPASDAVFGATPSEYFWTSTPWVGGGSAWYVYFVNGYSYYNVTSDSSRVWCVR